MTFDSSVVDSCQGAYYGKLIGQLTELHHDVSGEVYAVDGRTLFLKNFNYNGEGPGNKPKILFYFSFTQPSVKVQTSLKNQLLSLSSAN